MGLKSLREAAKEHIDNLPSDQLKVAAEFLRYLDERASEEATAELVRVPGLLEELAESETDVANGKSVDWREVRGDV